MPVHVHLLVESGIHIIECLNLEQLAAERRYTFLFVATPLKIRGGTGSPIRPLAIAISPMPPDFAPSAKENRSTPKPWPPTCGASLKAWNAGLTVRQFPGGHSNLTYLLEAGGREYVLRRPPLGPVAPKAHDMAREYNVLGAVSPAFSAGAARVSAVRRSCA